MCLMLLTSTLCSKTFEDTSEIMKFLIQPLNELSFNLKKYMAIFLQILYILHIIHNDRTVLHISIDDSKNAISNVLRIT